VSLTTTYSWRAFPCQAFSVAGKRLGFEDTRGTLFFEIARIAKVKRPKAMLLENVKGLVGHDKGKTLNTIIQTLCDIGYTVDFEVLNSKYFGVPQNREREYSSSLFVTI
jgi:DNA (cytosine-5)-methyltransferase 1